jgi:hypothetical protein
MDAILVMKVQFVRDVVLAAAYPFVEWQDSHADGLADLEWFDQFDLLAGVSCAGRADPTNYAFLYAVERH